MFIVSRRSVGQQKSGSGSAKIKDLCLIECLCHTGFQAKTGHGLYQPTKSILRLYAPPTLSRSFSLGCGFDQLLLCGRDGCFTKSQSLQSFNLMSSTPAMPQEAQQCIVSISLIFHLQNTTGNRWDEIIFLKITTPKNFYWCFSSLSEPSVWWYFTDKADYRVSPTTVKDIHVDFMHFHPSAKKAVLQQPRSQCGWCSMCTYLATPLFQQKLVAG